MSLEAGLCITINLAHVCCPQLSKADLGENDCAVTMFVEKKNKKTLYKPCFGPCVCVCVLFVDVGHCGKQCASMAWFHLGPVPEGCTSSWFFFFFFKSLYKFL